MIQLGFPDFLLSLLFLMAAAVYLLRRWERWISLAFGAILSLLGLWLWRLPMDVTTLAVPFLPVSVSLESGVWHNAFRLQLTPANAPVVVALLFLLGAGLMLVATANQGQHFPVFALLLGAGYTAVAQLVDAPLAPALLTPIFLAILLAVSIFPLQTGRLGDTIRPLRTLLPPVLATPFVLLAIWYIEQIPLNPQDMDLAADAAQLLAIGLLLLLAPVPLHSAQPALSESSPPIASALTLLSYQTIVLAAVYWAATNLPLLTDLSSFSLWLTATGLVTAVWGGLAAAGTAQPGRLWGYALLHDWGLILLILAGADARSWPLVISLFALRLVSTLSAATGLAQLRRATGDLQLDSFRGVGARLPWSTTAFLLGGLGLAGFPLTAGFAGHWSALQALAEVDWRFAAIVLISSGGVVFGFIRMVGVFFGPAQSSLLPSERPLGMAFAIGAILLVSGLAIAPQLFAGPIAKTLLVFN